MMQILSVIGVAAMLWCEGFFVIKIILPARDERFLSYALAYPLGVFLQTLLFFLLAICGLPWTLWSIAIAHALVLIALFLIQRRLRTSSTSLASSDEVHTAFLHRTIFFWSAIIITAIALSSILYASVIPSFYWDAFTNWAMRSKQSFVAGKLLLDGVVQPQYPILIHSLQISPMLLAGWHDRLANIMTVLLSLSGFASLFLLVRRTHGTHYASLITALLLSVPLVIIHLRQSYADVHLSLFILLSAAFLDRAVRAHDHRSLLLSAVFCAAAMWTKLEGVYAGIILWMMVVCIHNVQSRQWKWSLRWGIAPIMLLTMPWIIFLWTHGLKTSPHGFHPALHLDAVPLFFNQLLLQGMFGLHWWAIFSLLGIIILTRWKSLFSVPKQYPSLLWGVGSLGFFTFTYLCTDEVTGLIHADNFSRALMMPTLLLTYGIGGYCVQNLFGVRKNAS